MTDFDSHNPILTGHEAAIRQVAESFAGGRMHHAWLITGIEGIGKATLAWHIAAIVAKRFKTGPE
jgi:DNA polymerase-3 subunit delta'